MNGIELVAKTAGPTSHDLVGALRRSLPRGTKVGHAGTLDPFATGLVILLVGGSTRLSNLLMGLPKRYRAVVQLGTRSQTGDPEGPLEASGAPLPTAEDVAAVLARFRGEISQVPPSTSAIRIDGRRAYARVRAGEQVEMPPRVVEVTALELIDHDAELGRVSLDVRCSKGTYIRALARDIGEALGCGGYCLALERSEIGSFALAHAGTIEQVIAQPGSTPWFVPPRDALAHLPERLIDGSEASLLRAGRPIASAGETGPTRCVLAEALVCLAEPRDGILAPTMVLSR